VNWEQRRFLQEPHGVTSQKTPFFKITAYFGVVRRQLILQPYNDAMRLINLYSVGWKDETRSNVVVDALCYKAEGRGFETLRDE
jgi:hypothetical protein